MEELSFKENEFDLIWSEGAIYIMGFEKGIKEWKRFIKPGGYIAVSEITWLTDKRPKELEEYWMNECPEIDTAANKIRLLEKHGYIPTAYFVLPQYCWMENYYDPIQKTYLKLLDKHGHSDYIKEFIENDKKEIHLYEKYKDYYSYGFYIAQKI